MQQTNITKQTPDWQILTWTEKQITGIGLSCRWVVFALLFEDLLSLETPYQVDVLLFFRGQASAEVTDKFSILEYFANR